MRGGAAAAEEGFLAEVSGCVDVAVAVKGLSGEMRRDEEVAAAAEGSSREERGAAEGVAAVAGLSVEVEGAADVATAVTCLIGFLVENSSVSPELLFRTRLESASLLRIMSAVQRHCVSNHSLEEPRRLNTKGSSIEAVHNLLGIELVCDEIP